jgi:D-alanine-D-alanine ligase
MKVGLTYDLRQDYLAMGFGDEETAEFDAPETIDALEQALASLGHETQRIGHLRALVARLLAGESWDLVFNIAEGMHGVGREAQVPALLDAWEIPYVFSDPLVCAATLHKGVAKRLARDLGIRTAPFAVVGEEQDLAALDLPFPLFVKPLAEGTSKGVSARSQVTSTEQLAAACRELLARYPVGVLVESYLPGREVTVGIVGSGPMAEAVGVMEVLLVGDAEPGAYSFANKEDYETRCRYQLVGGALGEEARRLALEAWRGLGCRDGGRVDLREDAHGRLCFLEVNPLPGLHPRRSDLPILCRLAGIGYDELIRRIVASATARRRPVEVESS